MSGEAAVPGGLPERQPLDDRDTTERMGPDDMATLHEALVLQAALLRQRQQAGAAVRSVPGVCSNCAEACLPQAVYCDEDCRADHELRLRRERATGGVRGVGR